MRLPRFMWPASYRGRIAVVMLVSLLVVGVGVQGAIRGIVDQRIRSSARETLQEQALAIAVAVDAAPDEAKGDRAADAARFLPDTRITVTWPAPGGIYYNLVRIGNLDTRATARSGGVEARLERGTPAAGLADWLVVALFAGGVCVTAAIVWGLASALARRLRRDAAALAESAKAVAAGDLTARAAVTDDELGRVAAAFNAMAVRLAEADARQRRFLADIAHELRTPVTAIDGFASALTDGAASTPEARGEAVGFIREEATRLRELIGDLRELTLLDLRPARDVEPFDLAEAARDTATRLAGAAYGAGVRIDAPPAGEIAVCADRSYVETILANLVTNAIAATPAGGRVRIAVGRDDPGAWFAVEDTGVGIAPEHLPRIFDRLYRVDDARTREAGGSGLGLAIVRGLVDALGGTIEVRSAPGAGTTFTVRLPASAGVGGGERAIVETG